MRLSGQIADAESKGAIPYASVTILDQMGVPTGLGMSANENGQFSISDTRIRYPNQVAISSAGYVTLISELDYTDHDGLTFILQRDVKEIDPVVVGGSKNKGNALWLLLAIPLLMKKKQQRVGEIQPGHLMMVGGAIVFLKGFSIFNDLLEFLGLQKSENDKLVDSTANNPGSAFSPTMWQQGPAGTYLLSTEQVITLGVELLSSFGGFDDDEAQAAGVFKQMKTQSQVSYFSYGWLHNFGGDRWKNKGGSDLLTWLRGTAFPNDRLDNDEIADIIKYVNKLPLWKP